MTPGEAAARQAPACAEQGGKGLAMHEAHGQPKTDPYPGEGQKHGRDARRRGDKVHHQVGFEGFARPDAAHAEEIGADTEDCERAHNPEGNHDQRSGNEARQRRLFACRAAVSIKSA
jgi:hypothetical protein